LYNVNIPTETKGIRITHQGGPYFSDDFQPIENDLWKPNGLPVWGDSQDDTLDTDAVMHGYISISPLTIDRTNWDVYRKLTK
jgi:broad specificity polyphosphatase/5'/3'-nucleotidase SurE